MSLTSSVMSAAAYPHFTTVVDRIESWVESHPNAELIDPRRVLRDLNDLDPLYFSIAFNALAERGGFHRVYMIAAPSGVLVDVEYEDPNHIPREVYGRGAVVVPVIKRVG